MRAFITPLIYLLSFAIFAIARPGLAAEGTVSDFATTEDGRRYRVQFPLHDRIELNVLGRSGAKSEYRLAWKDSTILAFPEEAIWWNLRHVFASVGWTLSDDVHSTNFELLRGDYLRHDEASHILIMSYEDIRFPANFDIGVQYSFANGQYRNEPFNGRLERLRTADITLLTDFIRDENFRHRFALGVNAYHQMEKNTDGAWQHEISPLGNAVAIWGWESARGIFAVQARIEGGWVAQGVSNDEPSWHFQSGGALSGECALVAVNDAPIGLIWDVEMKHNALDGVEWEAGVGLNLALPRD